MIRVLFQGDSITDGNRYKDAESRWDLNHQIGHSYVYPIVSLLARKHPGKYAFINRGISGDCVDKVKRRWKTDALDEHPDILSLLLGINGNGNFDGCYPEGEEMHLRHFEETYRELLASARAQNPWLKLILIEPFCLPAGRCEAHYDDFMRVFARKQRMIKEIAQDFGAIFIPTQKRLEQLVSESASLLEENGCAIQPNEYWLWDGIHPTEAFHGYLAEWWLDAVKSIL